MAEIISEKNNEIVLQVKIKLNGSLIEMEEEIQKAVNEVGAAATEKALSKFDTNGSAIQVGDIKLTSKGKVKKHYETPYGVVDLERHVYQTSKGGKTYCPLDEKARIITSSTPRFAKIISYKYSKLSAREVSEDLSVNHGRSVARSFLQNVVDTVGSIAQATEEDWMYEIPKQDEPVTTVALSLDGTCILMSGDGYREAMTGTISLYNQAGERLHTIYLGAAPENGKEKFIARFEKEIYQVKLQYPDAKYVGLADGAKTNWECLDKHTQYQVLDFYHATEYLAQASVAIPEYKYMRRQSKIWLDYACYRLKYDPNAATALLEEMMAIPTKKLSNEVENKLKSAITYFKNQKHRMQYDKYLAMNLPIGSGVTEAACKTLVKQRLCQSGMKWKSRGAAVALCLRALVHTKTRWEQFWDRINCSGLSGIV